MAWQRSPVFAGRFYPGERRECERQVAELMDGLELGRSVGAVLPHAGWMYSGPTAALGVAGVCGSAPETAVLFGAVHVPMREKASVCSAGEWQTPLGSLQVDEELASLIAGCTHVSADPAAHRGEHSIEVELPLLQHHLHGLRIVPIMVRPGPWAEEVGRWCAARSRALGRRTVFLGSTDLTHYGPAFGFEPAGRGEAGIRWAKDVNDRRFIKRIERMDAAGVVPEVEEHRNACGAGAIAALLGAMLELGAEKYVELRHATSAEVEKADGFSPVNSVGYEAGVFMLPG